MLTTHRRALPPALCAHWLRLLAGKDPISRPLTQLPLESQDVLQAVADSALGPEIEAALGAAPWCNLAQSWLRHGRPPHGWHQDGALRHDFMAHHGQPVPEGAALEMRTAWIALTPCGEHAPGLEWLNLPLPSLLTPAELSDAHVAATYSADRFDRACMQPGDALLFDGLLLHRTHLTMQMALPRTSLELRFFRADAVPPRVAGDEGLRLANRTSIHPFHDPVS